MISPYYPGITELPDRDFAIQQAQYGMTSGEYYAATQKQRAMERGIRETKRSIAALEQAGMGLNCPEYVQQRLVLGKRQRALSAHCKQNGLNRLYGREKAYGVARQPRSLTSALWRVRERGISLKKETLLGSTVNVDYIKSKAYRDKFKGLTGDKAIDDAICNAAITALTHRSGTPFEDLLLVSTVDRKIILNHNASREFLAVSPSSKVNEAVRKNPPGTLIGIHNHPSNIPPTGSDFAVCGIRDYFMGVAALHNGDIYLYKLLDKTISGRYIDTEIRRYGFEHVLKTLSERGFIAWKKL